MMRLGVLAVAAALGLVPGVVIAAGTGVQLPSGLEAGLMEGFVEVQPDGERWARFRYVMPALAGSADFELVQQDFVVLCEAQALPMLSDAGEQVSQVIVSLMDKPLEFGQSDPGTVQYFETFAIRDGRCIWEEF
ncbi:MAG: DUF6497 family protein [Rhodobacterales bacterium]|nr:DUF6497 family protein [Rhodobacterales bacterium]MDX5389912.1 DUF6497 family protein [Rhodobacterales bacterium]MDX5489603.1 DUF6497 family protein [Rhodobacterales bacterium]